MKSKTSILISLYFLSIVTMATPQTVALWTFDEQIGLYPSCVISDLSENDYPLVIGPGGSIVAGKFGNALATMKQPPITIPDEGSLRFGLEKMPVPPGRTVEPLTWFDAHFCALMTSGEKHLRKEVGFVHPTDTDLNLGNFDWTVEFWFYPERESNEDGVVFELGQGPRGENDMITALILNSDRSTFRFVNAAGDVDITIPSDESTLKPTYKKWSHFAFVYDSPTDQLFHYVNGVLQPLLQKADFQSLKYGDEDYLSVGCNGRWQRPLPGKIDELRFSKGKIYTDTFDPPDSFSYLTAMNRDTLRLYAGKSLLVEQRERPFQLADRKHLFIDELLVSETENITFVVNPPRPAERVIENIRGPFRKHLNIVEDETGLIRLYNAVDDDYLAVRTSRDGIHWDIPELPHGRYKSNRNIVLHEPTGMGVTFIDPNAPPNQRWKYISDFHRRGIFVYSSADGYSFKRQKIAVLPFRSGSQSNIFYDDQRQLYIAYHRSDFGKTKSGDTERDFVMTECENVLIPWPFRPVTQEEAIRLSKTRRVHNLIPWYLDNGPLTPGGFSLEFPWVFTPDDHMDPRETDIYVPKAMKYPWAEDTYLAFPVIYFHYEETSPLTRAILMDPERVRGSGPIETQVAVSRDGIKWTRYPRPAYVGNGFHQSWPVNQAYMAHGMVRRGNEIWQYYFGTEIYHSTWNKDRSKNAVYRVIQRLDGFVSADTPYDREGRLITKPFVFKGNRLLLNIDTDAAGYAQIGFLDQEGKSVPGYSVDDCIYINGDFVETEVEWMDKGKDVSPLAGKVVRLEFRMRGSKLYAMQFKDLIN